MASADFPFALTKELSPGKALILSLHTVRLYLARLGWTLGFTVAGTLTARTRPLCRFVFLRSKVCFPLPSAWPRGLHPTTSALRFPTVTSIGPGRIVSSCENQPMLGTLAHASSVPCRHSWRHLQLPKTAFENIVYDVYTRQDREYLEPRSGGRNIAQGGAEGETLGRTPIGESPVRAAGRPPNTHFHGGIMNSRFLETDCTPFARQAMRKAG